ncbi:hypothetical protein chiPu_0005648 [Chiloscyllium punctatum]|uniref:C2H2-type domain-containing protein n=1 Tax=Chiloscyllium punctatum TaxID=137246 RepID=A0A401SA15_CHIPU|nr:hypothetical protein [Chiloscyllium punctatum]
MIVLFCGATALLRLLIVKEDVALSSPSVGVTKRDCENDLQRVVPLGFPVIMKRFLTDAARREREQMRKRHQAKLTPALSSPVGRGGTPASPHPGNGSSAFPGTPPVTPSSSACSGTPTGSELDEEEIECEDSDSDESWTTESAISSETILSSMCLNGDDEKPFACPVPGCKKRYKNVNGIKYHAKNGHRTQSRVRKPFKCRCGKSYKTAHGLRHHTITFHPPVSVDILRKMQL